MEHARKTSPAFSLVELSIVLVILGLLVGGILAGQSLIRAAELRSVTAEATKYKTATMAFRDKYLAYPGDMANATKFWGAIGGNTSDNYTFSCIDASTTTATCNGNDDGMVALLFSGYDYEEFTYWKHLGNAGLIEGRYNGMGESLTLGLNIPGSKLSNAGWRNGYYGSFAGGVMYFAGEYGFMLQISVPATGGGVLRPSDAWNIDTKTDDGRPGTGTILAGRYPYCTNASSQTDKAATYTLTVTTLECTLYFTKN